MRYIFIFMLFSLPIKSQYCGKYALQEFTKEDCDENFKEDSLRIFENRKMSLLEQNKFYMKLIENEKTKGNSTKKLKEAFEKIKIDNEKRIIHINSSFEKLLADARENRNEGLEKLKFDEENEKKLITEYEIQKEKDRIKNENDKKEAIINTAKEKERIENLKKSLKYNNWKKQYVSRITKAKALMSSATQIRKKYVFKNMWGERKFDLGDFTKNDKANYLKIINDIGDILNKISWDNDFEYENLFNTNIGPKDSITATDLFSISQFYNSAR